MSKLTHLKRHIFALVDETVSVDIYVDYDQLRKQAIRASRSASGESRDGALVVKVLRRQEVKK